MVIIVVKMNHNLIRQEFKREFEKWTDLMVQRRQWYFDQKFRLVDRTFQSVVSYSSISAAFIAIVFPLLDKTSPSILVALWAFSLNVLFGVILGSFPIFIDKKELPKAMGEELSVLRKFQSQSLAVFKDPTEKNIDGYFRLKDAIVSEIENKTYFQGFNNLLSGLYVTFLLTFLAGFFSLLTQFITFDFSRIEIVSYQIINMINEATSSTSVSLLQSIKGFIPLLSSLGIGSFFGYWFKDKLEQNADNRRKTRDAREKQYKDFLNNLMGFFEGWEDEAKKKQFIRDVHTNASLYASDDVLKLAYKFIGSFNVTGSERQTADAIYSKLVLAIRKELNQIQGEIETELTEQDIKVTKLN